MNWKFLGGAGKKVAQEAAEEAAEGASKAKKFGRRVKEAKVSGSSDDIVKEAVERANSADAFIYEGKSYLKKDGQYYSKTGKGKFEPLQDAGVYEKAHSGYVEEQRVAAQKKLDDMTQQDLNNAFETMSKGPGDDSGFDFSKHPYISTAVASSIALGVGYAFGSSDDDEEA